MEYSKSFAVIGGGSWATAIVKMLCQSLDQVHWYMRNEQAVECLQNEGHNPNYLSAVTFNPDQLCLTTHIDEAVIRADCLIFVIPSAFLYKELSNLTVSLEDKIIYSAIKGIVPESGLIVGEHLHNYYQVKYDNIGVISGPCHAEEVALERLSYLTIACADTQKAQFLAKILNNAYIRCNVSKDVVGIEYAALLKNIYAIAAGIFHGLGYGDNFQSVLMSNAIRELDRFVDKADKVERNINDSAYLGDLLVTGYSSFSRNRMFGAMIGKGYTVKNAQLEMNMIAEGYYATKSAYQINNARSMTAETPIIDTVYHVLYQDAKPGESMMILTSQLD